MIRQLSLPGASLVLLFLAAPAGAHHAPDHPAGRPAADAAGRGFNPKISLILQGTYAEFLSDVEPGVPGVVLGPETEPRPAGFSLAETELVVESNIDDRFHGWATVALHEEDGETHVEVEEAYVNTLALPYGLAAKAGRFFSDIGYQNRIHSHAWEFVDLPLVYRALLANQLNDDGAQLRWVAPTDLLVEAGVEALRGREYPGGGDLRDEVNALTGFVHLGGDLGAGGSWRLGLSHLDTDADVRETGEDITTQFTGDSELSIVDLVFKWAPDGNPAQRNLIFNTEYFNREERGDLVYDPDALDPDAGEAGPTPSAYAGEQSGFYAQGVVQFMPRWRTGVRYDRLDSDNVVPGAATGTTTSLATLADNDAAQRYSVMVDFSNSEFSRIRAQYSRDETRPGGVEDDQFFLQYVMSLGAHPAHQF